jgi:valyl-tRNA synthetase
MSRLTGTGGTFNAAAGTLYRQTLLPVRLNIYFQQHLHVLQMRASLQINVNNQPDAGTDGNTTVCESSVSSIDLFG